MKSRFVAALFVASAILASSVHADWIPTNQGIGADTEVRESAPAQNFGSGTDIALRVRNDAPLGNVNDGFDRNSAIYAKFDIRRMILPPDLETAFRLTYRNNNLVASRIQDTITPNPGTRTGLAIYGLQPGAGTVELTVSNATPRVVANTVERTQSLNPGSWTEVGGYLSSPGVTNWSEPSAPGWDPTFYRILTE